MPISGPLYFWGKGVKGAPDQAGVYTFYTEDKKLIFMGGSSSLKKAFNYYLEGSFKELSNWAIKYYRRELSQNWAERVEALSAEYGKVYGTPSKLIFIPEKTKIEEYGFGVFFIRDLLNPGISLISTKEDLCMAVQHLPFSYLGFHQKKGSFARWVRILFGDSQLAEKIEKLQYTGEELRQELVKTLMGTEKSKCPRCNTVTDLKKKWTMAGRANKKGEKLQLTIGFFKCNNCGKVFRKVLKKELIKP